MKYEEYLELFAKEHCEKCKHQNGDPDCEMCKCFRYTMREEGNLSPEEIKVVRTDVSFALGILVSMQLLETEQMKEVMTQASEALSRALNNLIVEKPYFIPKDEPTEE